MNDKDFEIQAEQVRPKSEIKYLIIAAAKDAAMNFGYYDRKNDEDLSTDDIENAIKDGLITIDEIVAAFRGELEENI